MTGNLTDVMGINLVGKGLTVKQKDNKIIVENKQGIKIEFNSNACYENATIEQKGKKLYISNFKAEDKPANLFDVKGTAERDQIFVTDCDLNSIKTLESGDLIELKNSTAKNIDLGMDTNGNKIDELYLDNSSITGTKEVAGCIKTNELSALNSSLENVKIQGSNNNVTIENSKLENCNIKTKCLNIQNSKVKNNIINTWYGLIYNSWLNDTKVHSNNLDLVKTNSADSSYDSKVDIYLEETKSTNDNITAEEGVIVYNETELNNTQVVTDSLQSEQNATVKNSDLKVKYLLKLNNSNFTNNNIDVEKNTVFEVNKKTKFENNNVK